VTGDWKELHNEELHNLWPPETIQVMKSRRMRLVGHVTYEYMHKNRNAHRVLVEKTERKRKLGRPWQNYTIQVVP
jgi:hypothetical protein